MSELMMRSPQVLWRPRTYPPRRDLLRQLAAAVAATLAALVATRALATIALATIDPSPSFLPFVAAVAVSARYAGRGAGLLTSVLSLVVIDYAFLPPVGTVDFSHPAQLVQIVVFLAVALLVGETTEALRAARREAEGRAAELARRNDQLAAMNVELEQQMEEVQTLSEQLQETNGQLERSYDEERDGRRTAEAIARAREEILGMVAHDLRNPLNLIGTTTQFLVEVDPPVDQRRQLLDVMTRGVAQMNRLIDDLLDVVRIEAGRLSLDVRDTSVRALLGQVEETFRAVADKRCVRLDVQRPQDDVQLRVDAGRVLQALGNLVGNALKFTRQGGRVLVSATCGADDLVFTVQDAGPGIAPEHLGRLFDRFWQGRTGDRRGLGLGLTIARGIAEAHGGRIWAESRVGEGSTFAFAVPTGRGR